MAGEGELRAQLAHLLDADLAAIPRAGARVMRSGCCPCAARWQAAQRSARRLRGRFAQRTSAQPSRRANRRRRRAPHESAERAAAARRRERARSVRDLGLEPRGCHGARARERQQVLEHRRRPAARTASSGTDASIMWMRFGSAPRQLEIRRAHALEERLAPRPRNRSAAHPPGGCLARSRPSADRQIEQQRAIRAAGRHEPRLASGSIHCRITPRPPPW